MVWFSFHDTLMEWPRSIVMILLEKELNAPRSAQRRRRRRRLRWGGGCHRPRRRRGRRLRRRWLLRLPPLRPLWTPPAGRWAKVHGAAAALESSEAAGGGGARGRAEGQRTYYPCKVQSGEKCVCLQRCVKSTGTTIALSKNYLIVKIK